MMADLARQLTEAFHDGAIRYCHWKENYRLEQSLAGEDDLEILIDRRDGDRAISILYALGFRQALAVEGDATPGIFHFYGLDVGTGRLLHVHLYTRLLTGESAVKSHWLPCEQLLLENRRDLHGIKVPNRSAELIVHLLRIFVKYGSAIDLLYLHREAKAYAQELRWLEDGADRGEIFRLLRAYAVPIGPTLFARCWSSLHAPTVRLDQIRLGMEVRRCLGVHTTHTAFGRALRYARALFHRGTRSLLGRGSESGKRPAAGGAVIAVVGPEATGKSTLVAECDRWLRPAFSVWTIHPGKPPSARLTLPLNAALALGGILQRQARSRGSTSPRPVTAPPVGRAPKGSVWALLVALRAVALAWDRRQLLAAARRSAANGRIVVCDRYPSRITGAVDSPRLRRDPSGGGAITVVYNWLAQFEERLYTEIPPPDLVLRLRVSLATAKQRNHDRLKVDKEGDAYLEFRHRQSTGWERPDAADIFDIDTEQSLSETIRQAKRAIWGAL